MGRCEEKDQAAQSEAEQNEEDPPYSEYQYSLLARMATDMELFSNHYFSHFCTKPFNEFHYEGFESYEYGARGVRRLRGAPRGYAKSTIKGLIEAIHDFCYELEPFTLIVSDTKPQANLKIKDIRDEFLNNSELVSDFDIRFDTANPGATEFIVHTENFKAKFQAVGVGSSTRGIRFGAARPSKIIFDDVEDSEEVYNEELREKLADRYQEDFIKLGNKETNVEFVGTVLHKKSLLKTLSRNAAYDSKIYKAVISWSDNTKLWNEWEKIYTNLDDDSRAANGLKFFKKNEAKMMTGTQVLWPEAESYYDLMTERVEIGKRAFAKEKQNDPIADDDALFDNIQWYHETDKGLVIERTGTVIKWRDLYAYGAIDPATGEGKTAKRKTKLDYTCIVGGYKDTRGRLFVHHDWTKRARPTTYIDAIFSMHEQLNFEKFVIETNLFRNLLTENVIRERKKREAERKKEGRADWALKIPFYEIENRDKKEKRIFTLEPKVSNGYILFNRALGMDFMDMLEQFPNGDHDDGPDALEMLWGLVNNRYKPSPLNMQAIGRK